MKRKEVEEMFEVIVAFFLLIEGLVARGNSLVVAQGLDWESRVKSLITMHRYDEAQRFCETLVRAHPENEYSTSLILGDMYFDRGNWRQANIYYGVALNKSYNRCNDALSGKSRALSNLGETEEAARYAGLISEKFHP